MSAKTLFTLSEKFLDKYTRIKPPFGFNGLGEIVYRRTYSRLKPDGTNEDWWETVRRVVEGTYRMQQRHIQANDLGWSEARAIRSAQEMYDRMFFMKFLPPGRGLQVMGSLITEEKGLYAALNNCGFTSTAYLEKERAEPFAFLMDGSMLGVGIGFDTRGAGTVRILRPKGQSEKYVIPDTREGWVNSTAMLIDSYLTSMQRWDFDYSEVREEGEPIKGFGGYASGPAPLIQLHEQLREVFSRNIGKPITERTIVDTANMIGVCVVSGNVRRTAEIAFGEPDSEEFLSLKDYRFNEETEQYEGPKAERAAYGWTSNNSVFARVGMDYERTARQTAVNGEPGYFWLDNAQRYGRMVDAPNNLDKRAMGANPCLEQTLEHRELCCLVESFPSLNTDLEDYKRTLKFAYLYAKTVTLGRTHWPKTNRVMLRNRRIGTSMSGVANLVEKVGVPELIRWCDEGYKTVQHYDRVYSDWLTVPLSIKTTSVKPSGSISNLPGVKPGMHRSHFRYGIRRVQMSKSSTLVPELIDAGYPVEPSSYSPDTTVVVEVPVSMGEERTTYEVSMWEQLSLAALLQEHWADNQVSCTISFDPVTEGPQIKHALEYFQYKLKGVSFLPNLKKKAYPQMPYEAITKEEYEARVAALKPLNFGKTAESIAVEGGCSNDSCEVKFS